MNREEIIEIFFKSANQPKHDVDKDAHIHAEDFETIADKIMELQPTEEEIQQATLNKDGYFKFRFPEQFIKGANFVKGFKRIK